MNITHLSFLLNGNPPKSPRYDSLDESRKERIKEFITKIPERYPVETIKEDIDKLSLHSKNIINFVDSFPLIGVGFAILFFLLYSILFGVGTGLLVGVIILVSSTFLNKQLGDLFDLSQDSKNLIQDYDDLLAQLHNAQRKQNKHKAL